MPDTGGDTRLLKGDLNSDDTPSGAITVTVTGVPAAFTTRGYAVVGYADGDNQSEDRVGRFTVTAPNFGQRTLYARDPVNVDFDGTFTPLPSTSTADLGSSTPAGNVLVFATLTDAGFTLTVKGGSATDFKPRGALNGFQIVEVDTLPHPPGPVITSSATATGTVNEFFTYTITAINDPTSFAATGLPPGLRVNSANGVISGVPTAEGTFQVDLTASNVDGFVSNMEFFRDGARLGEDASAPYRTTWKPRAPGAYTLVARATDSLGAVALSPPVRLAVGLPPLHTLIADGFTTHRWFQLCFSGEVGQSYRVQGSTNFLGWTDLGTMTDTNGLWGFLDQDAASFARRFYRAVQQ